jgi:predicted RNase H-like HicB family nuclease
MKRLTYRILLNREPEGGYTVTVPALPGCVTYGENVDEAIAMAKEAIELYIESLIEHNEPVPD